MGRIKRTYTFEQLITASIDAALSVFPPEHRQGLREPLLSEMRNGRTYSTCDKRRIYRESHIARAIAAGVNGLGPDMLAKFNELGGKATVAQLREGTGNSRTVQMIKDHCSPDAVMKILKSHTLEGIAES